MTVHKPPPLTPGARIGVVAPAGCVEPGSLLAGVAAIEAQGYNVELAPGIYQNNGYLAGAAADRGRDLANFFRRSDIAAIFCARGGFGSIQTLEYLGLDLGKHPKLFVGYSDITILLNWLRRHCGMVTIHGPMVATDLARGLSDRSQEHFWGMLSGRKRAWKIALGETLRPGQVEAEMIGGCLSMLVTTLGTAYEIDSRGKILFLEDVGEAPYRVERMLMHLKMAGKLDHLAGVVFGDFTLCGSTSSARSQEDTPVRRAPGRVRLGRDRRRPPAPRLAGVAKSASGPSTRWCHSRGRRSAPEGLGPRSPGPAGGVLDLVQLDFRHSRFGGRRSGAEVTDHLAHSLRDGPGDDDGDRAAGQPLRPRHAAHRRQESSHEDHGDEGDPST